MNSILLVTIDGPAGVGKSTLAKRLAERLDIAYLDTGAMFRTIALGIFTAHPEVATELPEHKNLATTLASFSFTLQGAGTATQLLCNNAPVSDAIRTEEAGMKAARVAVIPAVREFLKHKQQELGAQFSLVAEGRDMGTVVFPKAQAKFFLDARVEIRAERRFNQLVMAGEHPDMLELTEQIRQRDEQDRNRPIAPLKPADDAHCIDTSEITIDDVLEKMLACIRQISK